MSALSGLIAAFAALAVARLGAVPLRAEAEPVSAVGDAVIELTTFDAYDTYWVRRNWAAKAPIKTQSRIDTPKPFARPRAGTVPVAGVAWAQHRGIERVEVRVDNGAWHEVRLAAEATEDTWRQWVWEWPATRGSHTLEVRATDGEGRTQTGERTDTVPDGATGRHSVVVEVT